MLYTRQIFTLLVGLYTVRVILDLLGVEDYGIYNVVGGVVTLLSFLSGTMASATQRFFSFTIGQGKKEELNKILSVNMIIYLGIAALSFFFLETIGLWYVKNKLVVPDFRMESVVLVYHLSILSFITTIFSAPLVAIIIAYEDMQYYTYVSIIETVLKLGVVFLLMYIDWDKLELYAFLNLSVTIIGSLMYVYICFKRYKELNLISFTWDKKLFKEIVNFTGWTLFGRLSTVSRNQAITVLLNQMFSPITVAARAVSMNIATKINMFSSNFNIGLYPPIIKSYAANEKEAMYTLIYNGSKITFFLLWVFALPLFIELDMVLGIWLKKVPPETVLFTRLSIIESLIFSISLPLGTAARAPGKMKKYELILGTLQLLIFFIAWGVLAMGYPAYSIYIVAILINVIMFVTRLYLVEGLIGLKIMMFVRKVIFPLFKVVILSLIVTISIKLILPNNFVFSMLIIVLSILSSSIFMYFIALTKEWRLKVRTAIATKLKGV